MVNVNTYVVWSGDGGVRIDAARMAPKLQWIVGGKLDSVGAFDARDCFGMGS